MLWTQDSLVFCREKFSLNHYNYSTAHPVITNGNRKQRCMIESFLFLNCHVQYAECGFEADNNDGRFARGQIISIHVTNSQDAAVIFQNCTVFSITRQ
jgi:hypothetical protein